MLKYYHLKWLQWDRSQMIYKKTTHVLKQITHRSLYRTDIYNMRYKFKLKSFNLRINSWLFLNFILSIKWMAPIGIAPIWLHLQWSIFLLDHRAEISNPTSVLLLNGPVGSWTQSFSVTTKYAAVNTSEPIKRILLMESYDTIGNRTQVSSLATTNLTTRP